MPEFLDDDDHFRNKRACLFRLQADVERSHFHAGPLEGFHRRCCQDKAPAGTLGVCSGHTAAHVFGLFVLQESDLHLPDEFRWGINDFSFGDEALVVGWLSREKRDFRSGEAGLELKIDHPGGDLVFEIRIELLGIAVKSEDCGSVF